MAMCGDLIGSGFESHTSCSRGRRFTTCAIWPVFMNIIIQNIHNKFLHLTAFKHAEIIFLDHNISVHLNNIIPTYSVLILMVFIKMRWFDELFDCCVAEFVLFKASYCLHAEISHVFYSSKHIHFLFTFNLFNQVVNCAQDSSLVGSITKQNKFVANRTEEELISIKVHKRFISNTSRCVEILENLISNRSMQSNTLCWCLEIYTKQVQTGA